jgi:hypothetical protein
MADVFSSSVQEVEDAGTAGYAADDSGTGVYADADEDGTGIGEYASLDGLGASMVKDGR